MTAKEIIKRIEEESLLEFLFNKDSYNEAEIGDMSYEESHKYLGETFGEIEWLDSREDTSEFWSILYLKDHNVYLKIEGEFDSYMQYEHSYDSVKEVLPKQVTKTVYE